MSAQDPNRGTDLPGHEAAVNPTPMRDESRRGTAAETDGLPRDGRKLGRRRLGLAVTAVVLGLLSFVVGLRLFTSSKPGAPADGSRPLASTTDEPAAGNGPRLSSQLDIPALRSEVFAATKALTAKDGNGPPAKDPAKQPAEPKPDPKPEPKPELEPWPPATLAFAGKKAGGEWSANGSKMKFCWCPAGTFVMGSPKDEKDRGFNYSYEEQVEVKLTKGFWLGKYEVTQAQWDKVMGTDVFQQRDIAGAQFRWESDNPDATGWWDRNQLRWRGQRRAGLGWEPDFGEGPNYPMYYVNHLEASDFCAKLTEQERKAGRLPPGWEYRLPTEAQWEYACRAGTKTATAFGDTLSSKQANFDGNYPYNGAEKGPILSRLQPRGSTGYGKYIGSYFSGYTQPVGSYPPNAWGLHDVHGNVWEWCRDWDVRPLPGGPDPEARFGDVGRMVRGGSWRSPGKLCRSANRIGNGSRWTIANPETGFRVALAQLDPRPKPAPEPKPQPAPKEVLTNSIGMKLAPIPAGKFLMGSPVDEPGRPFLGRDEVDYEEQHPVTIREPFYLGVYLVTQEQYEQIMGKVPGYEPSFFSRDGAGKAKVKEFKDTKQFPRDTVSWDDAREFCRRLSELPEEKKAGRRYRLPTEEEWEYACRAGTTTPYYFGKTISQQQANFSAPGPDLRSDSADTFGRTTPVGYYNTPNKFGLHDMHGNLLQWCDGEYGPYQLDLRNPNQSQRHPVRGGYWGSPGIWCRSAYREAGGAANKWYGFRVALSVGAVTP